MKQTLYLGLELPPRLQNTNAVHCPFIRIVAKHPTDRDITDVFKNFKAYTHLIFTSKSAVRIFFDLLDAYSISREEIANKTILAVGQHTAQKLKESGTQTDHVAATETAEGIIETLASLSLENAHVFLPQSAIARPVICDWLAKNGIACTVSQIYTTVSNLPPLLPDLSRFHEIIFTSPSTVDAFIEGYGTFPKGIKLTCIGPVTERKLFSFIKD